MAKRLSLSKSKKCNFSRNYYDPCSSFYFFVYRRCFAALGFDEYWESHGDGLQILRYNLTTAYNTHLDYFEDKVSQLVFHGAQCLRCQVFAEAPYVMPG
jgi:hypothetical protein